MNSNKIDLTVDLLNQQKLAYDELKDHSLKFLFTNQFKPSKSINWMIKHWSYSIYWSILYVILVLIGQVSESIFELLKN